MDMEQQHKKPAANAAASSPGSSAGSSSSSRAIHGSMSSAFLGVSSSTHSQRRSSPSLCPPLAQVPLPGHLASRGSPASGSYTSASGSLSSQFNQISPSPTAAPFRRRPRPNCQVTHSLPSPFLSELSSICRMGANVFDDLNAQEIMTQRQLLHGQQEQEMTYSSSLTMPHSHHPTPILPSGEFSGFPSKSPLTMRGLPAGLAPPPLQQQQAQPSFSSLKPLHDVNFSAFPLPASQPQQMQLYSSTDMPSRTLSALEPLTVASQHFSTYHLAPLPSPSRTTIFQSSSSCSSEADHAQPSSDSELPPLPPSLEMQQYGLSPLGHLSQNNGSSTVGQSRSGFLQPSSNSETCELAPLPDSRQMPPLLLQQDQGWASLPTSLEDRLHLGGSGTELSMRGAAEAGVGQTCEAMPTPTPAISSSSIPWNCHGSMPMYSLSEEQALQQLRDLLSLWSSTASSSCDQSMGSIVAGSSQGWAAAAMPALANKFDMMSIGGSSCSAAVGTKMHSNPVPGVPKLILGGMDRPGLPPWPPVLGAGGASSSMSRRGYTKENFFCEADMEKINKDNGLKELVQTDPKRVKRILRNRVYVARLKAQKENHIHDLQRRADALKIECTSLSAQVQSHKKMFDKLKTDNREMQKKLKGLYEQAKLKQDLNHQLQAEVQRLKLLELNMLCVNGTHNENRS